jgi:hypothetical protein
VAAAYGGGIYNNSTGILTAMTSTFSGNSAYYLGGGIGNYGTLNVTNSSFLGNIAEQLGGGGVFNGSMLTVTNSTFSSNNANNYYGGGIINYYGTVTLINSTLSNNSATYYGGGIENDGTLTVTNSIIANSLQGGDCDNIGIVTGSHNLVQDAASACGLSNGTNGNLAGIDPLLGPLANNGGSTLTFLLLAGSPAINAGGNDSCPAVDQRTVHRPQGGTCDIGAVESLIWPRTYLPMTKK